MKTIYLDYEFRCYTENDGTMTAVETEFFDGKCDAFVKGYRYIPSGESWTRSDGEVFRGEMIAPWIDYTELDAAQRKYEKTLIAEYESSSILSADLQKAYEEGVASA